MNAPENNPDFTTASRSADGNEKYETLSRQITILFAAIIVTSFTLTAYLGLEARRASVELLAIQPRANEVIKAVQQDDATVQSVYGKLAEFGRTHPDFQAKILFKYKINTNTPPAELKK